MTDGVPKQNSKSVINDMIAAYGSRPEAWPQESVSDLLSRSLQDPDLSMACTFLIWVVVVTGNCALEM